MNVKHAHCLSLKTSVLMNVILRLWLLMQQLVSVIVILPNFYPLNQDGLHVNNRVMLKTVNGVALERSTNVLHVQLLCLSLKLNNVVNVLKDVINVPTKLCVNNVILLQSLLMVDVKKNVMKVNKLNQINQLVTVSVNVKLISYPILMEDASNAKMDVVIVISKLRFVIIVGQDTG